MDLRKAEGMAKDLMGWYLRGRNWSFQFDRSLTRLGLCNHRECFISLGTHATSVNEEKEVLNTLLHEIAHALIGPGAGHGPEWKAVAKSIGCTAERTGKILIEAPAKYTGECPNCSKVFYKYRKPKLGAYHGQCGLDAKVVWKEAA